MGAVMGVGVGTFVRGVMSERTSTFIFPMRALVDSINGRRSAIWLFTTFSINPNVDAWRFIKSSVMDMSELFTNASIIVDISDDICSISEKLFKSEVCVRESPSLVSIVVVTSPVSVFMVVVWVVCIVRVCADAG